jgi:uncharacterized protein (UPF0264 family)
MRLLVSVRSAQEVVPALEGGADIVDAKEPANGSLGPVTQPTLLAIARQVPDQRALSVALGDLSGLAAVRQAIERATALERAGETFVKLGFADVRSPAMIASLLAEAVKLQGLLPRLRVIAVAYADHTRASSAPPGEIISVAAGTGAGGVLLDTFIKDGRDLFCWLTPPELESWVEQTRAGELLAALAGSLRGHSFEAACSAQPDIVGVRGAACVGGRTGPVKRERVRELRALMEKSSERALLPLTPHF